MTHHLPEDPELRAKAEEVFRQLPSSLREAVASIGEAAKAVDMARSGGSAQMYYTAVATLKRASSRASTAFRNFPAEAGTLERHQAGEALQNLIAKADEIILALPNPGIRAEQIEPLLVELPLLIQEGSRLLWIAMFATIGKEVKDESEQHSTNPEEDGIHDEGPVTPTSGSQNLD